MFYRYNIVKYVIYYCKLYLEMMIVHWIYHANPGLIWLRSDGSVAVMNDKGRKGQRVD